MKLGHWSDLGTTQAVPFLVTSETLVEQPNEVPISEPLLPENDLTKTLLL